MNLEDYKFEYKPSIYILFREAALDFRIASLGVKMAGHYFSLAIRAKYPNGAPIGLSNNLPDLLQADARSIYKAYGLDHSHIYIDEARQVKDYSAILAAIKQLKGNRYRTVGGLWINKPSKWQQFKCKLKSFFRS